LVGGKKSGNTKLFGDRRVKRTYEKQRRSKNHNFSATKEKKRRVTFLYNGTSTRKKRGDPPKEGFDVKDRDDGKGILQFWGKTGMGPGKIKGKKLLIYFEGFLGGLKMKKGFKRATNDASGRKKAHFLWQ